MGKACSRPSAEAGDVAEGVPELIYFNGPGRGELARLAFKAGGVEFTDTRLEQADWPPMKADASSKPAQLFGQIPVVARGEFLLGQSSAVAQYASDMGMTKAGVAPTAQQRALDTMIIGAYADLQAAMYKCLFGDDEAKAAGKAALAGKVTPLLEGVERQYKGDGPFLYGATPTLGDLAVYNVVVSPFPGLKALEFDLAPFAKIVKCADACEAFLAQADAQAPAKVEGPAATGLPELIYFGGPGRAEVARLAFAAGSVEYTDTHIDMGNWPAVKGDPTSAPARSFGQMPVVAHGDFLVGQSTAVSQYAADLGINQSVPPTDEQRGLDFMMLGAHADLQTAMYGCLFGDDASKAAGKEALSGKVTPVLEGVERQYKSDGPFLYSPEAIGPTLGDLALFDAVASVFPGLKALGFDLSPFKKVERCVAACQACTARPGLKAYLDKRAAAYAAAAAPAAAAAGLKAICVVGPEGKSCDGTTGGSVSGEVAFEMVGDMCKISYKVSGLTAGLHGFHVHEKADFSNGCASAGPHYNPSGKTHGGPEDDERHAGDLGNIEANAAGVAEGEILDGLIKLDGETSVIGRSIMVHADPDDLGKGDHSEPGTNGKTSKTTGNAGARVACGEIKSA